MDNAIRYVIFGAGAIGTAVGGWLMRAGSQVELIARNAQAESIRHGITIRQEGDEFRLQRHAMASIRELDPTSADLIMITTKSQHTEGAVEEIFSVYGDAVPVVCLQNGTRNEEIAARRFSRVYAGLVFISAVQLRPDLITLPLGRSLAVGCYPSGLDSISAQVCEDLKRAGFEVLNSSHVMAMKWGKLVANLNNATHAITGYWLEGALADPEMREIMLAVRDEGLRVLDAAGIPVEPPPDQPSPIRIRGWTEKLRQSPPADDAALKLPEEKRTYASMWQDLYMGRKSSEADFLNGEIIERGKELGIPTPYNSILLETVDRMFAEGLQPGLYTPAELHALIRRRERSA
jgi:2-dehydropantoate 2-reductase